MKSFFNIQSSFNLMGLISFVCVILGGLCFLLFFMLGSSIDSNGFLQEPFALLPIGFFFSLIGIFLFIISFVPKHKLLQIFFLFITLGAISYSILFFPSLLDETYILGFDALFFLLPISALLICLGCLGFLHILISNIITLFKKN